MDESKTAITGDVASKPGYQIPRKAIKIIYFDYLKINYFFKIFFLKRTVIKPE